MEGVAGLTTIETSAAGVTVSFVVPEMEPEVAVMVVVPVPALVAKPWVPVALLTVATGVLEELHCTELVRFWVLPSLKVPVAANCCLVPNAIEGLAGVTAIEFRTTPVEPVPVRDTLCGLAPPLS